MSKLVRKSLLGVAFALLLAPVAAIGPSVQGNLVDAKWLQSHLHDADLLIFDASPAQIYTTKHIPGALSASSDLVNVPYGLQDMPLRDVEALYQSAGISQGKKVVIYDQSGTLLATRLFFSLLYHGVAATDLFILNGGLSKWEEQRLPVTNEPTPAPPKTTFKIRINEKVSVLTNSRGLTITKESTIVGPRKSPSDVSIPPTSYPSSYRKDVVVADPKSTQGLYPTIFIASAATIPANAPEGKVVHVPCSDLLDAYGTPKAATDIWNILSKAGVSRYGELISFSDDPGEAAANYFVLKLMGYPDIKVLAAR